MVMKYDAVSPDKQSAATPRQCVSHWSWIYGLGLLLAGLLLFAHRQPFSEPGHMVLQCVIVLLVYGLLARGLQPNRTVLGVPTPAAKPKLVYVAYTPVVKETAYKPVSFLQAGMARRVHQSLSLSALPLHDGVSLQDRRNSS